MNIIIGSWIGAFLLQPRSQKMAESQSFHEKALSHISGSFLFLEKYWKQNFNLSQSHLYSTSCYISRSLCQKRSFLTSVIIITFGSVNSILGYLQYSSVHSHITSCFLYYHSLEKNQSCETKSGTESLGTRLTFYCTSTLPSQ